MENNLINSPFSVNKPILKISYLGKIETQKTIDAADKALSAWRAMSAKQRSQILNKWFYLIMEN